MSLRPAANHWSTWAKRRNKITSHKGGWRIGDAVYNHGFSMMDELVGKVSYFQLMVLNITGELPSKKLARWLEASFICLSWPDSRIWCNQVGALAGSSRTTPVAAVAAGVLSSDSLLYGPGVLPNCIEFIQTSLERTDSNQTVKKIVAETLHRRRDIPGFARPIAKGDERVTAMQRVSKELGFSPGPHESLAMKISEYLTIHHDECINFGGYMAAFLADQGLSGKELNRIASLWVAAGVQACYAEAADNPAGTYLPLRCDDIVYTGHPPRELD